MYANTNGRNRNQNFKREWEPVETLEEGQARCAITKSQNARGFTIHSFNFYKEYGEGKRSPHFNPRDIRDLDLLLERLETYPEWQQAQRN